MVAGAFPIAKLGALALRQLSKPLANRIKSRAKSSPFFRTYICMPPAQIYHWIEVNVKMRMMNLGKPSEVPKLNENMAIELGAELLGESIIFGVAVFTMVAEYIRSSNKDREKEAAREARFTELEDTVYNLKFTVIKQEAEMRHLIRIAHEKPFLAKLLSGSDEDPGCSEECKVNPETKEIANTSSHTGGVIQSAIQAATQIVTGRS